MIVGVLDASDGTESMSIPINLPGKEGQDQDLEIEKQRPVVDVVKVMLHTTLHLLEGVGFASVTVDLSPAGNAGLDVVTTVKRRNEPGKRLVLRGRVRTGANEGHVAHEHVE